MNFPQNLKKLMTDRKLSAYKMANDLHCSQTTIRNWVDGKTTPQPRTIIQLCEYFDVSEEKLLGSSPEQKNSPGIKNDAETDELYTLFNQMSESSRTKYLELARIFVDAERKNGEI